MAQSIQQQIQEYKNAILEDRAQAEQIREQSIAAGTWGKQQGYEYTAPVVTVPEEKKTTADKMWDRAAQPLSKTTQAKQKANSAKKKLDDYLASDEKKQSDAERNRIAQQKQVQQSIMDAVTGNPGGTVIQPEADPTEARLRAEYEQAQSEADAAESEEIMQTDLDTIASMSDEDRSALEQYAVNQIGDQNTPIEMVGVLPTAKQKASGLIEKYGQKRVDELAETYMRQQNAELAQNVDEQARQQANEHGVLSSLATIPVAAVSGVVGSIGQLQGLARNTGRYKTADPNATGTIGDVYTGAVRGQVAQNIEQDNGFAGKVGSVVYQGAMSAADSIARAYLGGGAFGGAALAATNSFSQTMADASRQGATPAQAALLATVTAGIEAASEKIPLDDLIKTAKGQGAKSVLKNIFRQAGIEATTEEISLWGTLLAEAAILQEKSGYQQTVTTQLLMGKSLGEAKEVASKEILDEVVNTALVSAVAGIGGGVSASFANEANLLPKEDAQAAASQPQQQTADQIVQEVVARSGKQETQQQPQAETEVQQPQQEIQPVQEVQEAKQPAGTPQPMTEQERISQGISQQVEGTSRQMTVKEEVNSIKEQLRTSQDTLNAMNTVADIRTPQRFSEMNKSEKMNWVIEKLRPTNYKVDRKGFGVINFASKQLKSAFNYFKKGSAEEAAFEALPYVLENGTEISSHADHKGREYGTVTFAAPVTINGKRGNMAVVVKQTTDNFYKVHRILAPDGSIFDLSETENKAESTPAGESPINGSLATPIDSASENSVTQNSEEVNKDSANSELSESTPTMDTQNQSTDGGQQIKGTGAAEQNFSQKSAYNATLSEDNSQADRRNDVRPMELPKTDINGNNVSAVTANAYGSQNTPDDLAAAMEEPVARGDFSYMRITNDEATRRAQKTIENSGSWKEARDSWRLEVDRGVAGAEMSARGALLLNHAAEVYEQTKATGNEQAIKEAKQEWLTVLADVRRLGTNTAQGQQAMRLIRSLMPEDKLEFAKAAVRNMVRDMKLNVDITIDENLLNQYEQAQTDQQRDEIMEQIQQNVADQIPSTMLDKWAALRYTNMLGNLKTNVRNIFGNVGSKAVYKFKDSTAAVIENIANKVTKGKVGRTKSLTVNRDLLKACRADFEQYAGIVSDGGKYGDQMSASDDFTRGVQDKRTIFKSNFKNPTAKTVADTLMKPMEKYRKVTNWAMNNGKFGDEAFSRGAYARALAGYLQANGVKDTDLSKVDSALMDKARAYAIQQAQEQTFHDNSALARIVTNVQKDTGIVGKGIMPFTKTPANVLTRAEEFSPLGLINSTVKSLQSAVGNTKIADGNEKIANWARQGQEITGTDLINSWSKTLTGTALFALGAIMQDQGLLIGGPDEDEDKEYFDQLNGYQNYAIQLPDGTNYTLDWLTPAAMPMFMGAQLWKTIQDKGGLENLTFADMEQVFTSIADPMLQMSMLQGLNDSLDSIKYSDNNLGQFFINAAVSYLTQGISNTLLGQIERSTEDERTTTYIDKESNVPVWLQKQLGSLSQKTPGWDYQQTPYINARGETEKQETGPLGLLYNLVSPGYVDKAEVDAVAKELYRLNDAGVEENVFPETPATTLTYTDKQGNTHENYNLSAEQADTLKRVTGQTSMQIVGEVIKSADYRALSDEQKAKAIADAYSYARETGEKDALPDYQGYSQSWMMEMEKDGEAAYIINRVGGAMLSGAMGKLDTAWDNNYNSSNQKALSDQLAKEFESYSKMSAAAKKTIYEEATGTTKKYIEAREKGVSHEDFLKVAKNVNTVKGTGELDEETGKNAVRDIDKREAIADTPGLSTRAKDILMRAYMTDYDPSDESPTKTEPKYDFIRQEMGLSVSKYVDSYRAYLDDDNKASKINAIMESLNCNYSTAQKLYKVYAGSYKGSDWTNYLKEYASK